MTNSNSCLPRRQDVVSYYDYRASSTPVLFAVGASIFSPAETLTTMVKRTRDLVYRPYNTANSLSPEFLPLKRNRDDVYYLEQQRLVPTLVSATSIEYVRVQAKANVAATVSIALKKPAKKVAFDRSVRALLEGEW
ncbi:uncharacterized protein J7T55_006960 [Diaporthe amygdali]|uniref:uncharacterized protein n=1 Tax=Phomopsis amygdali TaxID=1214568 RepID=UPI0022FF40EA|nr:uncharacterized protein J7T55_006960 [Diaporthe amygdali]KAJ0107081.1 uncharacterized protein J7T55_006960 [Diaporthe amygdali]